MDFQARLQETLGDAYRITRELTGGGMSRVFLAEDTSLGRLIVVKVLTPEMAAGLSAERFQREIRLMAQLQHPCIVPLLSAGETDGVPFYTMPYIAGESLRVQLLTKGSMTEADAIRVLRDVASALAYAHERGIVHRDIKPDNVLLSDGYAVVTDFGVAKALASAVGQPSGSGTLTIAGTTLGTPGYMAPEQALGDPTSDHRVDIYALGCLGYELLAGDPPFAGRSMQATVAAHIAERPAPIDVRYPEVSPALQLLILRCLSKAPEDRPQTARAVFEELKAIEGGTMPMTRASPVRKSLRAFATRKTIAWAAAIVLAALGVAGVLLARGRVTAPIAPATSVGILPFAAPANNGDSALAATGEVIANEIARSLRRSASIFVPSQFSTFAARNAGLAPRDIAKRLGVDALVSGVIERDGDGLRFTVRVLRGPEADEAWSGSLVSIANSLPATSRALTDSIVHALGVPPGTVRRSAGTSDPVAYDAYLRARHLQYRRGGQGLRRAAALFDSATRIDPDFAEAWAGMADALALLPVYENTPASTVQGPALAAATAALRLDETLAEAHTAIGNVRANLLDWEGAKSAFQRARELDPNNVSALQYHAEIIAMEGHLHQAIPLVKRAGLLDPLSPVQSAVVGGMYLFAQQLDSAHPYAVRAYELDPNFVGSLRIYGRVLLGMDSVEKGLDLLRRAPSGTTGLAQLGGAYVRAGRRDSARAILRRLTEADKRVQSAALPIAWLHLILGDTTEALNWIERAARQREVPRSSISPMDFVFRPLWPHPRFAAAMKQLGLDASEFIRANQPQSTRTSKPGGIR